MELKAMSYPGAIGLENATATGDASGEAYVYPGNHQHAGIIAIACANA